MMQAGVVASMPPAASILSKLITSTLSLSLRSELRVFILASVNWKPVWHESTQG